MDATPAAKPALRFLTCGSVDDGKSTLIGRLLWEQHLVLDDQLAALERDTTKHGTTGEVMDFALLVDGLEAERQQGITIDVAYRYFKTARRSFIVADTPGHEQYTRNMATGASNAELAILLVDARKGLLTQTHRHAIIASLLGIRHVVLAVNKIDLVDYDQGVFDGIVADFTRFAEPLAFLDVTAIPLSARNGDNLSTKSPRTPWYRGPALVPHLEAVDVADDRAARSFRMPVQWINRPNLDFRGFVGTVASGRVAAGETIVVAGSGRTATVARIVTADGDRAMAEAGDAVTLTLAEEIDVARGDVFAHPGARPEVGDGFAATLVWMADAPLRFGRSYFLKLATRTVPATVSALDYRLDVNSFAQDKATTLRLNEVGRVRITTVAPLAFDPYAANRTTGAFILIDREDNRTVAAGTVAEGLARTAAVPGRASALTRTDRARLKHQRPGVVWFTGPPGAETSAVAAQVEVLLNLAGVHTALLDEAASLDGDGGSNPSERTTRRAAVARIMADAGLVVLCAFVSPSRAERATARAALPAGEFVEVLVDGPADRHAADRNAASPYEAPLDPVAIVGRDGESVERAAEAVHEALLAGGFLAGFDDVSDWSI